MMEAPSRVVSIGGVRNDAECEPSHKLVKETLLSRGGGRCRDPAGRVTVVVVVDVGG